MFITHGHIVLGELGKHKFLNRTADKRVCVLILFNFDTGSITRWSDSVYDRLDFFRGPFCMCCWSRSSNVQDKNNLVNSSTLLSILKSVLSKVWFHMVFEYILCIFTVVLLVMIFYDFYYASKFKILMNEITDMNFKFLS